MATAGTGSAGSITCCAAAKLINPCSRKRGDAFYVTRHCRTLVEGLPERRRRPTFLCSGSALRHPERRLKAGPSCLKGGATVARFRRLSPTAVGPGEWLLPDHIAALRSGGGDG